jgi:RNA polymerase sigma-70 factor (ECF subfamily)
MEKKNVQRLFMQHYAKMLRVARTILGDEQESKDVVSDVFANLLHGHTVLVDGSEERYLLTSVRNQCLKRLRHEEVKQRMSCKMVTAELSTDMCDEDERMADIDEFVATHFSQQERRIFCLRFSDGCSYAEIAASEGISTVAVWKHLSHVLTLIRNHFKK